jgi:hypothetical protein
MQFQNRFINVDILFSDAQGFGSWYAQVKTFFSFASAKQIISRLAFWHISTLIMLSLAFARFHAVSKTLYSMSCILFSVAQECGSWLFK